MKRYQGFMLIEFLIATCIAVIVLFIIYVFYQSEMRNYQFNKARMEAVDKLWLSMDRIKEEVRKGKRFENSDTFPFSSIFPDISQAPDSLVFTKVNNEVVAFFTYESDGNLYKAISGATTTTAQIIAQDTRISANSSSGSAQVTLSTNWTFRGVTRTESITSKVALRNWRGY